MFENMKMIWQHKGSKVICKNTRLMTSFGILFLKKAFTCRVMIEKMIFIELFNLITL